MSEPTITVTNLGDLGLESVFGVIHPPQSVTATLSADQRVSDGPRGGRFLDRVTELLQTPEAL